MADGITKIPVLPALHALTLGTYLKCMSAALTHWWHVPTQAVGGSLSSARVRAKDHIDISRLQGAEHNIGKADGISGHCKTADSLAYKLAAQRKGHLQALCRWDHICSHTSSASPHHPSNHRTLSRRKCIFNSFDLSRPLTSRSSCGRSGAIAEIAPDLPSTIDFDRAAQASLAALAVNSAGIDVDGTGVPVAIAAP
ncbi:hypothetical protein BC832DRAFT_546907 [Gaertneriomyces semiglobifer]|nr:hypothetical protein BC832DRAFT_546907 [Gaertneriomyces semiglobifer]